MPAHGQESASAHHHGRQQDEDVLSVDRGQATHQPESDGGKLVVGVGQHLEYRDERSEDGAHQDAREHQEQGGVAAPQPAGQHVGDEHRGQPETQGQELSDQNALGQHDAEGGAEARPGGGAEDVRRHQRVAEHALIGCSRKETTRPRS